MADGSVEGTDTTVGREVGQAWGGGRVGEGWSDLMGQERGEGASLLT